MKSLEYICKQTERKETDVRKIVFLPRSELNSMEKVISKALTNAEISDEEITLFSSKAESCRRQKDRIRAKDSHKGVTEGDTLTDYA